MGQNFGIAMPAAHPTSVHRQPVRYLVVIDSGGAMVARLFLANRELVNELDAGASEVATATAGLRPEKSALGTEWMARSRAIAPWSAPVRRFTRCLPEYLLKRFPIRHRPRPLPQRLAWVQRLAWAGPWQVSAGPGA